MPAYWIARAKIDDPVEYKKYTDRVPAIIKQYGGKVLAHGGVPVALAREPSGAPWHRMEEAGGGCAIPLDRSADPAGRRGRRKHEQADAA